MSESYSAKDIQVLEGLEAVRKRPGMYIGSTGPEGLHHMIWEVVDNSIDEALANYAKNIKIEILKDNGIAVTDDGRGIPVEKHEQTGVSALETVLTILHAGGKFGGGGYKISGGLHGVGVSVVNALSTRLIAEVCRDGGIYRQEYAKGTPQGPLKRMGDSDKRGTKVTFYADGEIFSSLEYNLKKILDHLRQQAYLTKGVRIEVIDYRQKEEGDYYAFYFENGIQSFMKHLASEKVPLQNNVFYVDKPYENMFVEVAAIYANELEGRELSFVNNIHTIDGGTHVTGFRTAITRVINDYAKSNNYIKDPKDALSGDDVREGLISIISIKMPEPQFEGQTKGKLGSIVARSAVDNIVSEYLKDFLDRNGADAKRIIERCMLAAKARKAAKAAKETILRKGILDGMSLPGKLADCTSRSPQESEIFIVEGDSAGGTSKMGRDRRTQAILPLKGKILNVEKSRIDKMLLNQEIRSLVVALGTAIADEFDLTKLRYHKIVIMTDADVDGSHIRTLLLTLFYRYFKDLVVNGHIYIAQPPLYMIKKGKEMEYAYSDEQKKEVLKKFGADPDSSEGDSKGIFIQRYKGLGEMNAEQLKETTLSRENRVLKKVTMSDAEDADKLFDILMGSVVEPRKHFIQSHALTVTNLDI